MRPLFAKRLRCRGDAGAVDDRVHAFADGHDIDDEHESRRKLQIQRYPKDFSSKSSAAFTCSSFVTSVGEKTTFGPSLAARSAPATAIYGRHNGPYDKIP